MDRDVERKVLTRLVEQGLVESGQPEIQPEDPDIVRRWGVRVGGLVERGVLDEEELVELIREVTLETSSENVVGDSSDESKTTVFWQSGDHEALLTNAGASMPTWERSLDTLTGQPLRDWERYEIVSFLGQGGMGRVYKAWDPRLQRHVALKLLARDDPVVAQRFAREARAQARVEHPNVCRVYEVGEVEGLPYIAMQLVEGPDVKEARAEMSLEQRVLLGIDVAQAMHAAHRLGLIHRDIKPSNILVQHTEDDRWQPVILDFGLAREVAAEGLTATGATLGTPAYMAPEQAKGLNDHLDRRTDVYGIGATLYELLCGRPPFLGETQIEIVFKVVQDEARPLRERDSTIPEDLETIVGRCLEKEPGRRYDSARALAEDLRRYLDGEPIQARPQSAWYRAGKWLRRNRRLAVVAAVALVVTGTALGMLFEQRRTEQRRAVLAQQFGQDVAQIEGIMWRSRAIPLHDTRPQKELVRAQMVRIEEQMAELGPVASGPGHHALGSGHLALFEIEEARWDLERAWESGYQTPDVAHGLALAYGAIYERELAVVEGIEDGDLREAQRRHVEQTYREPAVRWLRSSEGTTSATPQYVEGRIGFLEGHFDEALALAVMAVEDRPWLYEAWVLQGRCHQAVAMQHALYEDEEQARASFALGEQALGRALAIAPSDVRVHERMAELKIQRYKTSRITEDGLVDLEDAEDQLHLAIEADDERADAHRLLSLMYLHWSMRMEVDGGDPMGAITLAIEAGEAAVQRAPDSHLALQQLGDAWSNRGLYEMRRGVDPAPSLAEANEHLDAAQAIQTTAMGQFRLGETNRILGQYQYRTGDRPMPALERAADHTERAIAINPQHARSHFVLGSIYHLMGWVEHRRGGDAAAHYRAAIGAFERSMEIDPDDYVVFNDMANTLDDLARLEMAAGHDPRELLQRADGLYQRSIELREWSIPHNNKADGLITLAEYQLHHGEDPRPSLAGAEAGLDRALELRPGFAIAHFNAGLVHGLGAQYSLRVGEDPAPQAERSREAFVAGLAVFPDFDEIRVDMARASVCVAHHQRERGRSPLPALERAEVDLADALVSSPDPAAALRMKAEIEILRARWSVDRGQDPTPRLEAAAAAVEAAKEANPTEAENHLIAAKAGLVNARWAEAGGGDAETILQAAVDEVTAALSIREDLAEALSVQGQLRLVEARCARDDTRRHFAATAAVGAFDAAVAIDANLSRQLRDDAEAARAMLGR